MITAIERQAEVVTLSGAEAGRALWLTVDCAIEAGMSASRARRVFDALLETIVDDMPADTSELFSASAYEALPMSATSTADRAKINDTAWRAYAAYCENAAADMEAAAIDHAYEVRRDERLMGAA
jgi:hypothetical protein